jgi:hypothetical protein
MAGHQLYEYCVENKIKYIGIRPHTPIRSVKPTKEFESIKSFADVIYGQQKYPKAINHQMLATSYFQGMLGSVSHLYSYIDKRDYYLYLSYYFFQAWQCKYKWDFKRLDWIVQRSHACLFKKTKNQEYCQCAPRPPEKKNPDRFRGLHFVYVRIKTEWIMWQIYNQ